MPTKTELTIHPDQLAVYNQVIAGLLFNSLIEISLKAEHSDRVAAILGVQKMMHDGTVRMLVSLDISGYRTEINVRVAAGGAEAHAFSHSVLTTWPPAFTEPGMPPDAPKH